MAYRIEVRTLAGTWVILGEYDRARAAWTAMRDLGWKLHWPTMRLLGSCGHVLHCTGGYERVPHW